MSAPSKDIPNLKLSDFGNVLVTRDQGESVRQHLMTTLQHHGKIEIDLDGVEAYTPSFVDELLGKCLAAIGTDDFRTNVTLIASSTDVRKLVNLVLSNRAAGKLS